MKYIVIVGNMSLIVGPFDTQREAEVYVAAIGKNDRWFGYSVQVTRIYEPSIKPA